MPTISAGALKRMPGLPANVVAGVPRVEKDPRGGDVVIVPVRPYARDMDRCARCGERGRPYDRLGVRRWRHLDIGCARLLLEHAPRRVDCAEHGVDRRDGAVARRKSAYTRDFGRQVAWLSVHAPRSAVSALMCVDWKSVGPICRRVPLGHRGVLEARREDRPPPLRHPAHHPVRTIQRSPGGRQQQDQDHHQDGLRLQEPRQPHRPGHAQMRRPQPPTPRTPITRKPDQRPTPTQTPEEPFFRMHSVMPAVLFRMPGKTPILTLSNNAHRHADRIWFLLSTSLKI